MWSYLLRLYLTLSSLCIAEKFIYMSTERPEITHINHKYISFVNITCRRYSRNDPFHYVDMHINLLWPTPNNISFHFVFYEWLTNRYKRGFIEMDFKVCDLVHSDNFFGTSMKQGKFAQPCPYPAGLYDLYNMTIPVKIIPHNFPFQKGRIYCNLTSTDTNELVGGGHIDIEIKEFNSNRRKKTQI